MPSTCLSLLGLRCTLQGALATLLFFRFLLWHLLFRNTFFLEPSFPFQCQGQVFEVQLVIQHQPLNHLQNSVSPSLIAWLVMTGSQNSAERDVLAKRLPLATATPVKVKQFF